MKRFYRIFLFFTIIGAILSSCDVDSTDYSLDKRDVYIDSIVIEAAKNSCVDNDIIVSVTNFSRKITATLPSDCDASEIILTIHLKEGISTFPVSGSSFTTGLSTLLVSGFGLEEEYVINLKVLEPFQSDKEFVSIWRVNDNGTITLPLTETGNYNFKVFWGDGQESIVAAYDLVSASHTYEHAGDYTVTVWGVIDGFNFSKTSQSASQIIDIVNWGQVKLGNDGGYFRKCTILQITAKDAPDFSETTSLMAIFREATSFNSNINHWDVSGITSLQDAFYKATNFDKPLDQWDVSKVQSFETMFRESAFNQNISTWNMSNALTLKNMFRDSPFNQPIGDWDISNVNNLQSTFRGNDSFNQDLSGWGTKLGNVVTMREMFRESDYNGDLSAWDVSKVGSMWDMFKDSGFNNPSIINWNVTNLDNMETMFGGVNCAFNQDISNWNVSNVVNMQNLFRENVVFNQDLSGWDVSNVKCNLDFDKDAPQWQETYKPKFTVDKNNDNEFCSRSN